MNVSVCIKKYITIKIKNILFLLNNFSIKIYPHSFTAVIYIQSNTNNLNNKDPKINSSNYFLLFFNVDVAFKTCVKCQHSIACPRRFLHCKSI